MTVLAIDRQQPESEQLQQLRLPGHIVAALQQLQLTSAVGWLRLVRLPAAATASSSNVSSVALSASKCYAGLLVMDCGAGTNGNVRAGLHAATAATAAVWRSLQVVLVVATCCDKT
jgi:hypothetical protein